MHTFLLFVVSSLSLTLPQLLHTMDITPLKQSHHQTPRVRVPKPQGDNRDLLSTLSGSSGSLTPLTSTDRLFFPKKRKSSSSSISPKSSPRSPKSSPRGKAHKKDPLYDELLRAVQKGNIDFVTKCLRELPEDSEINLNQKNNGMGNNTLLQLAVLRRNEDIVNAFFKRTDVTCLSENDDGRMACDFFEGADIQKYKQLHDKVTRRTSLDRMIRAIILLNPVLMCSDSSDELIHNIISVVKKNLPADFFPDYANRGFMTQVIRIRRKRDLFTMQIFLDSHKEDPNAHDEFGNKLIHYAAYLHDTEKITQLTSNPYLNTCDRNHAGELPHQLILSTDHENSELRKLLFSRNCLEMIVRQEAAIILFKNPATTTCSLENQFIKTCIENIKIEYTRMIQAQSHDRLLPQECALPEDANDLFIAAMLEHCIQEAKARKDFEQQQILKLIVKKETEAFLLQNPVKASFEDSSVKTSIENIKKEYNRMKPELASSTNITDRGFWRILQHLVIERKPNFIFIEQNLKASTETSNTDSE